MSNLGNVDHCFFYKLIRRNFISNIVFVDPRKGELQPLLVKETDDNVVGMFEKGLKFIVKKIKPSSQVSIRSISVSRSAGPLTPGWSTCRIFFCTVSLIYCFDYMAFNKHAVYKYKCMANWENVMFLCKWELNSNWPQCQSAYLSTMIIMYFILLLLFGIQSYS